MLLKTCVWLKAALAPIGPPSTPGPTGMGMKIGWMNIGLFLEGLGLLQGLSPCPGKNPGVAPVLSIVIVPPGGLLSEANIAAMMFGSVISPIVTPAIWSGRIPPAKITTRY